MTETRTLCDVCGKPGAKPVHYNFRHREYNGPPEWISDVVDLCHGHAVIRLQEFLREPPKAPAECGKNVFIRWAKNLDKALWRLTA